MATPHRVVDGVGESLANLATSLVNGAAGAVRGVGKTFMGALDAPFRQVTRKEGPHRIADRAADGALNAVTNLLNNGVIGTARAAKEGVMKALDQPCEQLGIPPDIGGKEKFSLSDKLPPFLGGKKR